MEELMRVEGLKMYFGGLKAIDGFDLTINKGETLGIIGPNGAGKTTLFNAICGVYKPTDGKVFLEGKEVQGTPAHEMAKMGIARTFQISKPLRGLTIFDNVLAAAGVHDYTGIGSYFHKSHTEEVEKKVSGGMPLSSALMEVNGFVSKLPATIKVGEETGMLGNMLESVAEDLDFYSKQALLRLTSYIEPVMIVVMAVVVGFIMISIIYPIYQSYQTIGAGS